MSLGGKYNARSVRRGRRQCHTSWFLIVWSHALLQAHRVEEIEMMGTAGHVYSYGCLVIACDRSGRTCVVNPRKC